MTKTGAKSFQNQSEARVQPENGGLDRRRRATSLDDVAALQLWKQKSPKPFRLHPAAMALCSNADRHRQEVCAVERSADQRFPRNQEEAPEPADGAEPRGGRRRRLRAINRSKQAEAETPFSFIQREKKILLIHDETKCHLELFSILEFYYLKP